MGVAEVVWHDDGHSIVLVLNQSELAILAINCPRGGDRMSACWHDEAGCIVKWFLTRFGLECHVGVAPPEPEMTIAWAWSGSKFDLDASQVWVMSTKDEFYSAWAASQRDEDT
jgi:hypothetical protein